MASFKVCRLEQRFQHVSPLTETRRSSLWIKELSPHFRNREDYTKWLIFKVYWLEQRFQLLSPLSRKGRSSLWIKESLPFSLKLKRGLF